MAFAWRTAARRALRLAWCVVALLPLPACVTVHAPLVRDASYPASWAAPLALGDECHGIAGAYLNAGVAHDSSGRVTPVLLSGLLDIPGAPQRVALEARTRRGDPHGDTFATLVVRFDGGAAAQRELTGCYCLKQTLACMQIAMTSWAVPNFGFGGKQRNLYMTRATDGALVGRLQAYHADVVLAVPVFSKDEPWVRFEAAGAVE